MFPTYLLSCLSSPGWVLGNDNIYRKHYKDIYIHTPMTSIVTYLGFWILNPIRYTKMLLLNSRLTIIWSLKNLSTLTWIKYAEVHPLPHQNIFWPAPFCPIFLYLTTISAVLRFSSFTPCSCKHDVLMLSITLCIIYHHGCVGKFLKYFFCFPICPYCAHMLSWTPND